LNDRVSRERFIYEGQVAAAALALKTGEAANWHLAELTFEACGPAMNGKVAPGKESLGEWAKDVRELSGRRFSEATAGFYRKVWETHGTSYLDRRLSWPEAWNDIIGRTPDKLAEGKVQSGDYHLATGLNRASPEAKQKALGTLLSEPEAAPAIARAMQDPEIRSAVLLATADEDTAERMRRHFDPQELAIRRAAGRQTPDAGGVADALDDMAAWTRLSEAVEHLIAAYELFVGRVDRILPEIHARGVPPTGLFLRDSLNRLPAAAMEMFDRLDRVKNLAETGQTDLDAFLGEVLKGKA
jgi:hypothetical protein